MSTHGRVGVAADRRAGDHVRHSLSYPAPSGGLPRSPSRYYEIQAAAAYGSEFHTLDGQCSSLIPQGPGYEGISIANQVCTTVGSEPGQATVDGNRYVQLSFNYSYSHLWRVSTHVQILECQLTRTPLPELRYRLRLLRWVLGDVLHRR